MHIRVIVLISAVLATFTVRAADELEQALRLTPVAARGESLFRTCVACHQADGSGEHSNAIPALTGQHYQVLVEQLVHFRNSTRTDIRMAAFAARHHLSGPQDIADVSAYVAALPVAPRAAHPVGEDTAAPRSYATNCAECHGTDGRGNAAARRPALAGQHFEYLLRQMEAMTSGERPAGPDHARTLATISRAEREIIARYLANR